MRSLGRDLRYAWRRLACAPLFTAFAVVTLAIGIGATTAIYSSMAAMSRPYAIRDIDRVVNLYHLRPPQGSLTSTDFEYIAANETVFSQLTAWTRVYLPWGDADGAAVVQGEAVDGSYFALVGVTPLLGRTIQPADDRPGADRVIVVSETTWRTRFAADADVLGRVVRLAGQAYQIVGVMPGAFKGVDMPNFAPTPYWIPLRAFWDSLPPGATSADRQLGSLHAKGRLKAGESIERAQAQMTGMATQLDRTDPMREGWTARTGRQFQLIPAADIRFWDTPNTSVTRQFTAMAVAVLVLTGLVLLVACTNLGNLVLARGASRRREVAVRAALGASRLRLIREQLVEALLVGVAGGVLAVLVARVLLIVLSTPIAPVGGEVAISIGLDPRLDPSALGVAAAATGLSMLAFGIWPALSTSRVAPQRVLASEAAHGVVGRWRARRVLIAGQVAVTVVLLALAGFFVWQAAALARRDTGIDLDRLAIVRVDLPPDRYAEAAARHFFDVVADRARQLPGTTGVAISSGLPVGVGTPGGSLDLPGETSGRRIELMVSTPAIFDTLGVRPVAGRWFDDRDTNPNSPVGVISAQTARDLFGSADLAIGRTVHLKRQPWSGDAGPVERTVTIVGVSSDMDVGSATGSRDHGVLFVPFAQLYETRRLAVVVRTDGDPEVTAERLRHAIGEIDSDVPIARAGSGTDLGGLTSVFTEVAGGLTTLLGAFALALALAGLYGVLSQVVAGRTREIGVRMTLGAGRGRILRMVLLDGLGPVLAGIALGAAAGWLALPVLRSVFRTLVPEASPIVLVVVPVLLLAAGAVACYVPARRAASVDPNVALREL